MAKLIDDLVIRQSIVALPSNRRDWLCQSPHLRYQRTGQRRK